MEEIITQPDVITSVVDAGSAAATAAEMNMAISDLTLTSNNIWMMVATFLVFIMHLGFAGVEAGFTQSKNTVNILFKNTLTPAIGLITYAFIGFSLMYPGGEGFIFNFGGWTLGEGTDYNSFAYAEGGYTYWTDFLFQAMFAATAATIVSGAVAERIKINAYLIFTVLFVGLVYPIVGSWKWGGGFLDTLGFYDFAGSTLVAYVIAGLLLKETEARTKGFFAGLAVIAREWTEKISTSFNRAFCTDRSNYRGY